MTTYGEPLNVVELNGLMTVTSGKYASIYRHPKGLRIREHAPQICRAIQLAWMDGDHFEAFTEAAYQILTLQPMSVGNEELAYETLEYMAKKYGVRLDLSSGGDLIPEWLLDVRRDIAPSRDRLGDEIRARCSPLTYPGPAKRSASGLAASIGAGFSGHPEEEQAINQRLSALVREALFGLGFRIDGPVHHQQNPETHPYQCDLVRNVDLLVCIARLPSTRLGHQLARVCALLSNVLVLVPYQLEGRVSCLFTEEAAGNLTVMLYTSEQDIRLAVENYVASHLPELKRHAQLRIERDRWHVAVYELLQQTFMRDGALVDWTTAPMPERVAAHLLSSIDAFSGASLTQVNALLSLFQLPTLAVPESRPHPASHLDERQRAEFDAIVAQLELNDDESRRLAQAALDELAARAVDRRTPSYRTAPEWLALWHRVSTE